MRLIANDGLNKSIKIDKIVVNRDIKGPRDHKDTL